MAGRTSTFSGSVYSWQLDHAKCGRAGLTGQDQAAWEALDRAMNTGEVATLEETRQLLGKQGVPYKSVAGVSSLLIRHKVKLKTGRPQHQQTDEAAQATFKKTSSAS